MNHRSAPCGKLCASVVQPIANRPQRKQIAERRAVAPNGDPRLFRRVRAIHPDAVLQQKCFLADLLALREAFRLLRSNQREVGFFLSL